LKFLFFEYEFRNVFFKVFDDIKLEKFRKTRSQIFVQGKIGILRVKKSHEEEKRIFRFPSL
jgi:hypothetical protein